MAALPPILVDVGALAGVGVAVFTFVGLIVAAVTRAVRHVVRDEIAPLKTDVATVKDEVTYNSGTSLKDAVRRIEHTVAQIVEHPTSD